MTIEEAKAKSYEIIKFIEGENLSNEEIIRSIITLENEISKFPQEENNENIITLMNLRSLLNDQKTHLRKGERIVLEDLKNEVLPNVSEDTESTTPAPDVETEAEATPTQEEETDDNLYQHNVFKH